jgi:predicted ATP-grasp superfamily ATP-dependent carboligase
VSRPAGLPSRALIIDRRAVLGIQLCRSLARKGCQVDILADYGSPAFLSRYCRSCLLLPADSNQSAIETLKAVVERSEYDEIYVCNEDLLALVFHLTGKDSWKGLLLPETDSLKTLLSKNSTITFAERAGIAVPRTFIPGDEREVAQFADRLGFPLVVKGERGESGVNVRIVKSGKDLAPTYLEIKRSEKSYGGLPALQEFIPGTGYSVGGLFDHGRAVRICAHRKILTYPPAGGQTVKGITERPPALLESALRFFEALRYNGLGHMEFIKDRRDERFKFLEINPRIWGSISIAECAGVDLFSPYRQMVKGLKVKPDLSYREGVRYHRFSKELHLIQERPLRVFGFLKDALNPRVRSDFDLFDPLPHLGMVFQGLPFAFKSPAPIRRVSDTARQTALNHQRGER